MSADMPMPPAEPDISHDETDYADTEYLYNDLMEPALTKAVAAMGLHPG